MGVFGRSLVSRAVCVYNNMKISRPDCVVVVEEVVKIDHGVASNNKDFT